MQVFLGATTCFHQCRVHIVDFCYPLIYRWSDALRERPSFKFIYITEFITINKSTPLLVFVSQILNKIQPEPVGNLVFYDFRNVVHALYVCMQVSVCKCSWVFRICVVCIFALEIPTVIYIAYSLHDSKVQCHRVKTNFQTTLKLKVKVVEHWSTIAKFLKPEALTWRLPAIKRKLHWSSKKSRMNCTKWKCS